MAIINKYQLIIVSAAIQYNIEMYQPVIYQYHVSIVIFVIIVIISAMRRRRNSVMKKKSVIVMA